MKAVKVVALLLVLGATPVFAAVDAFLQVNGIPGDSKDPAHAGWFDVLYNVSWTPRPGQDPNASPKNGAACQTRSLSFEVRSAVPVPSGGSKLMQMCQAHVVPMLTIEDHGIKHILQNVTFRTCTHRNALETNLEFDHFEASFDHCSTHPPVTINLGQFLPPKAQVIVGVTPAQDLSLVSLHFLGTTGSVVVQSAATTPFFSMAATSKQVTPTVTVKAGMSSWTFTDLQVTGDQQTPDAKLTFAITFTKVEGPPAGFQ